MVCLVVSLREMCWVFFKLSSGCGLIWKIVRCWWEV